MKKIILFSVLFLTAVLLYSTPKIDCNGNTIDCQTSELKSNGYFKFNFRNCLIGVTFSVKTCCNTSGDLCEYIIDIQNISTVGTCNETDDEIRKESIKFAITKTYELLNIEGFMEKSFHIKIPRCQVRNTYNYFGYLVKSISDCGDGCCRVELKVVNLYDKIRLQ